MARIIESYPISLKHSVSIDISQRTFLYAGGAEPKHIVSGSIFSKQVSFIEREFDLDYVTNWCAFKEAGLPVASTLHVTDEGTLLVADVKKDGSEVYGKGLYLVLDDGDVRSRPSLQVDRKFLNLTNPVNFPAIKQRAYDYVKLANLNNMALPLDDAFELIINPNGEWDLIILDLRCAKVYSKSPNNCSEVEERNAEVTDYFFDNLREIREQLLKRNRSTLFMVKPAFAEVHS